MDLPVSTAGAPLDKAPAVIILVHGRGGSAHDMLGLAREFGRPDLACLAPEAAGNTWYPYSFMSPIERNEPGLSSGLAVIGSLVEQAGRAGVPAERVVLLGFSQGACLTLEFVARNARRYGGVVGLSGGLIGPAGTPRDYPGGFDGTPVFLGCSDIDSHIPADRVHETARVFEAMGAAVTRRLYPGMGHTVNEDEIRFVTTMLDRFVSPPPASGD